MTRTSLMRNNPRTQLTDPFFRSLERFFDDDLLQPFGLAGRRAENLSNAGWMPAVDVRESEDHYLFTAELPGLQREDVSITIENLTLTLSGERKFEENQDPNSYHRVERAYGAFARSFTLPNEVDQEKVEANFKDGLLTISVPKAEQVKPRRIEIK